MRAFHTVSARVAGGWGLAVADCLLHDPAPRVAGNRSSLGAALGCGLVTLFLVGSLGVFARGLWQLGFEAAPQRGS